MKDPYGLNKADPYGINDADPYGLNDADPYGLDSQEKEESYNPFRSGAVDFLESAVGLGDELDALIMRASGEAKSWDEAITTSQANLDRFEEENETLSKALDVTGVVAGFLIPGAAAVRIGSAATKGALIARSAALGAAEGAAYGYASGRGEGRVEGALLGGALGGTVGAAAGKYLMKTDDEIISAAQDAAKRNGIGSHIGGDDGFVEVGRARERGRARGVDTTAQDRGIKRIVSEAVQLKDEIVQNPSGLGDDIALGMREWFTKNVGDRAGRLAEDAESMALRARAQVDEALEDPAWQKIGKDFEEDPLLQELSVRLNPTLDNAVSWDDIITRNAFNLPPEKVQHFVQLKKIMDEMSEVDPLAAQFKGSYLPALAKGEIRRAGGVAKPSDYENVIAAVRNYANEVNDSLMLANRFGLGVEDIKVNSKTTSRMEATIEAIRKRAMQEGASEEVADNLRNGLRTQFIAAKQGGAAVGSIVRKATSIALLGNIGNALLNTAEGVTAPIMQNGVRAWMETVPGALLSTLPRFLGGPNTQKWLTDAASGHKGAYMGEVALTGKRMLEDTTETLSFFRGGARARQKAAEVVDKTGEVIFGVTGVSTVNRMGREILTNSSIRRGMRLAKNGDIEKLRKHPGMRGLTDNEVQATVDALKKGDLTDPWVLNFAGASLNKWQPVAASAMPKAYHDNPDARMMYSMLSYMNRQMNVLRTDLGGSLMQARDSGLNTKEGQEALKDAYKFGAKYMALFGVFNGLVDQGRHLVDSSKDMEVADVLDPENITERTIQQIVSNATSGMVNTKAYEYGKEAFDPTPAPIAGVTSLFSGAVDAVAEDDVDPLLRGIQNYVPVVSNVDRVVRSATGERLLTGDPIAEVRDMIEGR